MLEYQWAPPPTLLEQEDGSEFVRLDTCDHVGRPLRPLRGEAAEHERVTHHSPLAANRRQAGVLR